jgi:hypothetical protein
MTIEKKHLDDYLNRIYSNMNLSYETDDLTPLRDMAFGVIAFFSTVNIITTDELKTYRNTLFDFYEKKCAELNAQD